MGIGGIFSISLIPKMIWLVGQTIVIDINYDLIVLMNYIAMILYMTFTLKRKPKNLFSYL